MSIILTIYVTLVQFIKTNVNHPNYICNIIKTNVNHPNYICNISPFYKKLMSIILTIYVTLVYSYKLMSIILTIYVAFTHFIKTNVNYPNYICNISPIYKN
jgi:hypothetical protein